MPIENFFGKYRFLSNFSYATVKYEGAEYPTVEHAYQAAKTLCEFDRDKIRNAPTAAIAKQLGKKVVLREDWDKIKITVMRNLLRQKFAQPKFRAMLLATGDEELVEGNYWGDTFWGVCRGEGENHLGKLLMEIRNDARANP